MLAKALYLDMRRVQLCMQVWSPSLAPPDLVSALSPANV
jgi:hypothetical protein